MISDTITEGARDLIRQMQGEIERLNAIIEARPSHVMCIGWATIKRLAEGEAVWFEGLQCGAVAADDLLGCHIADVGIAPDNKADQ